MTMEKHDLGPEPHVVIACRGNLEIRGSGDTYAWIDGSAFQVEPGEGGSTSISSSGNCSIRLPRGSMVEVSEVYGNLRVKDLVGSVSVGSVNGSVYIRRSGAVVVDGVRGEIRLREIDGGATVGRVSGSVTLRDVRGACTVREIAGELLARNLSEGIVAEDVSGNIALRSGFPPGSISRIGSSAAVTCRVPMGAGVRFVIPREIHLDVSRDMSVVTEGDQQIVMMGDGAATVQIAQASEVLIRQHSEHEGDAFAFSFAIGTDLSESLADLSADLETQFAELESSVSDSVSDRVRRHVERRLSSARRQIEAAQRKVEQETERAHRLQHNLEGLSVSVDFGGPAPARSQPVTEQERLIILKMLEEGRITVQQAEELLTALEGKGAR